MLPKTLSYSQARANFAETLNDVEDNRSMSLFNVRIDPVWL